MEANLIDKLRGQRATISVAEAAYLLRISENAVSARINDPHDKSLVRVGAGPRDGRRGRTIRIAAQPLFDALDGKVTQ